MKEQLIHNKKLPIPSFFQVYNFGGGNGDKDREIVYAELTEDTPALVNYFYINNSFKHLFQNKLFDCASSKFTRVGDLYNFIRKQLIKKGEIYSNYTSKVFDFNNKIFLLDSGAFSIVKYAAKEVDYDISKFKSLLFKYIVEYYDFANQLKFDLVVGFDLGGKYTEKDGEKNDSKLLKFLDGINEKQIHDEINELTIKYLKEHPNYYPHLLITVHGNNPHDFENNILDTIRLETKYNYKFWGYAIGGLASSKKLDKAWFDGADFTTVSSKLKDVIAPAVASKLLRKYIGDRYIHALGCGGYPSILLNYFNGANSFDAASPVRRVGDGNEASTKIVFDSTPSKESFSKYFIGGINMNGEEREHKCGYIKLNEVPDNLQMCGCPACLEAKNIHNIKLLYSLKSKDNEANYFSRQLIGLHAVWQHRNLCSQASSFSSIFDFSKVYTNKLYKDLAEIQKFINKF